MSKIKIYEAGEQLNRIANALEEVLRLVKKDQEDAKKRMLDLKLITDVGFNRLVRKFNLH